MNVVTIRLCVYVYVHVRMCNTACAVMVIVVRRHQFITLLCQRQPNILSNACRYLRVQAYTRQPTLLGFMM